MNSVQNGVSKNKRSSHGVSSSSFSSSAPPAKKKQLQHYSFLSSEDSFHGNSSNNNKMPMLNGREKKTEESLAEEGGNVTSDNEEGGPSTSSLRSLPLTKVRAIMESSPNGGDVRIGAEAIFAMAKAAESFVELLARGAHQQTAGNRIHYNDLSQYVHSIEELNFIHDILPMKQKLVEVLKLMKKGKR